MDKTFQLVTGYKGRTSTPFTNHTAWQSIKLKFCSSPVSAHRCFLELLLAHLPINCKCFRKLIVSIKNMKKFSGRRNNCILYALLYGGACITKHFASMEILMIGRFLGGIATSILYSAFESWLVYEHNKVCLVCFRHLRCRPQQRIIVLSETGRIIDTTRKLFHPTFIGIKW